MLALQFIHLIVKVFGEAAISLGESQAMPNQGMHLTLRVPSAATPFLLARTCK